MPRLMQLRDSGRDCPEVTAPNLGCSCLQVSERSASGVLGPSHKMPGPKTVLVVAMALAIQVRPARLGVLSSAPYRRGHRGVKHAFMMNGASRRLRCGSTLGLHSKPTRLPALSLLFLSGLLSHFACPELERKLLPRLRAPLSPHDLLQPARPAGGGRPKQPLFLRYFRRGLPQWGVLRQRELRLPRR